MDPPGEKIKAPSRRNYFRGRKSRERIEKNYENEDDYVEVATNIRGSSSSVPVQVPPELLQQQEFLMTLSKRQHQENQSQQLLTKQQTIRPVDNPQPLIPTSMTLPSPVMCRKSIHRKQSSLSTYHLTPITKHYEVSRQILGAFDSHWSNHLWVTAYAVGLKFVETALLEIPKHGYFYSKRHERERMENSIEAARVATLLKDLLVEQEHSLDIESKTHRDNEPTAGLVPSGDLPRVQKLLNLAMEQIEQASSDQDKALREHTREAVEEELRNSLEEQEDFSISSDWIICGEPLLTSISNVCSSRLESNKTVDNNSVVTATHSIFSIDDVTSFASRVTNKSAAMLRGDFSFADDKSSLTSPRHPFDSDLRMLSSPPPPPPTLSPQRSTVSVHSSHTTDELQLEKALFLSGLEVSEAIVVEGRSNEGNRIPPPLSNFAEPQIAQVPGKSNAILELSTLSMLFHEDFDSLQKSRRIRISFADSYQGRLPDSTNGCTVIAPLLCTHHLNMKLTQYHLETGGDPGLPDSVIEECIDLESPGVLSPLRKHLGLSEQAFLIPADVHDYLIDIGQLSVNQFCGVVGGNILDESHLNALFSALDQIQDKKIAATLFFHEHVVAITKLRRTELDGRESFWYDLIDSLPLKVTFCRMNESASDFCQRLGLFSGLTPSEISDENEIDALPRSSRTRCLDLEALAVAIRWYACSKFTDENMAYIDQYPWDDAASDFDPRVFQSFIWKGLNCEAIHTNI